MQIELRYDGQPRLRMSNKHGNAVLIRFPARRAWCNSALCCRLSSPSMSV